MHGTRQLNDQYFDVGLEESKLIETQTTTPKLQIEKSIEDDQNKTEDLINELNGIEISQNNLIRSKRGSTGGHVVGGVVAAGCLAAYISCGATTLGIGFLACYFPYLGCMAGATTLAFPEIVN